MRHSGLPVGFVLALSLFAVSAQATAGTRLEWQPGAYRLSWHDNCSFSPGHGTAEASHSHRFATLEGSLRTFGPADASLYAVFLRDRQDVQTLRDALADPQAPRPWDPENLGLRTGRLGCEWIQLDVNGHVTLRVDEANQSGKSWVAVVNSRGEILGAHPLWSGSGELASVD